jgi:SnoaL-like domain
MDSAHSTTTDYACCSTPAGSRGPNDPTRHASEPALPTQTRRAELARLERHVAEFTGRNEITNLVYRLGAFLDERRFDEMRSLLVDAATVRTPGGTAEGREAVIDQACATTSPTNRPSTSSPTRSSSSTATGPRSAPTWS